MNKCTTVKSCMYGISHIWNSVYMESLIYGLISHTWIPASPYMRDFTVLHFKYLTWFVSTQSLDLAVESQARTSLKGRVQDFLYSVQPIAFREMQRLGVTQAHAFEAFLLGFNVGGCLGLRST